MFRFLFLLGFTLFSSFIYADTVFKESYSFTQPYKPRFGEKPANWYDIRSSRFKTPEEACAAYGLMMGYSQREPYDNERLGFIFTVSFPYFLYDHDDTNFSIRPGSCWVDERREYYKSDPRVSESQTRLIYINKDGLCPFGYDPDANGDTCTKKSENTDEPDEPDECEVGLSGFFEFHYCTANSTDGCIPGTQKTRPSSFCKNSCLHIPNFGSGSDADCYSYINNDGSSGPAVMCSVTALTNGGKCSGDYSAPTPDNSCPSGTVSGEVNGKRVCVPAPDPDPDPEGGSGGSGGSGGDGSGSGSGGDGSGSGGDGSGSGGDGSGSGGDGSGGNGSGSGSGSGGDGSGNGSGSGGDGDGEGEGDDEGEGIGAGESVENCPDGRCDFGDGRGDPFGGDVRSFSSSLTAAMNGMKNSPLGNSIGNIHFPSGGTCPTGSTSINIGIGSIPIDFIEHCNFWEQIAPILSAVFLAFWAIIAVRVFLSA